MHAALLTLSLALALAGPSTASPLHPQHELEKRGVSCLKVGSTATASWTDGAGRKCVWSGVVGGNFGANSVNGGE